MNVLFQRLSGWLHLMPLIGKRAVLLTSSCGNGIYMVNNYMKNIAWGFGMRVISVLNVIAREKADLDNETIPNLLKNAQSLWVYGVRWEDSRKYITYTCLKAKHIRKCQKKYRIQPNVRGHSTLLRFRKNEL